jgi:hypothetical protein
MKQFFTNLRARIEGASIQTRSIYAIVTALIGITINFAFASVCFAAVRAFWPLSAGGTAWGLGFMAFLVAIEVLKNVAKAVISIIFAFRDLAVQRRLDLFVKGA